MNLIKRCYGCGKRIYPWQDMIATKLVGTIHRGCAFNAITNYQNDKEHKEFRAGCEAKALKALNKEETK